MAFDCASDGNVREMQECCAHIIWGQSLHRTPIEPVCVLQVLVVYL